MAKRFIMFNPLSKKSPPPSPALAPDELARRGLERYLPDQVPNLLRFATKPKRKQDILPYRPGTPMPTALDMLGLMTEDLTLRNKEEDASVVKKKMRNTNG